MLVSISRRLRKYTCLSYKRIQLHEINICCISLKILQISFKIMRNISTSTFTPERLGLINGCFHLVVDYIYHSDQSYLTLMHLLRLTTEVGIAVPSTAVPRYFLKFVQVA